MICYTCLSSRNELRKSLAVAVSRVGAPTQRVWATFWSAHQRFFKQLWLVTVLCVLFHAFIVSDPGVLNVNMSKKLTISNYHTGRRMHGIVCELGWGYIAETCLTLSHNDMLVAFPFLPVARCSLIPEWSIQLIKLYKPRSTTGILHPLHMMKASCRMQRRPVMRNFLFFHKKILMHAQLKKYAIWTTWSAHFCSPINLTNDYLEVYHLSVSTTVAFLIFLAYNSCVPDPHMGREALLQLL